MVEFEEDSDKQTCICRSPKMASSLLIRKDRSGYIFFEVVTETGPIPKELSGKYSTMTKAKEAVEAYLRGKRETAAVRRDNFAKEREAEKNGTKSVSESR